jgi:hypothetical protein
MKYRHSFNPEGKTKIKGKEHLDITGYFPKVGKKKTIPIELDELWVSDENPDDKYGSIRTIGRVSLVDDTIYYQKELQSDSPHYGMVWNDTKGNRGWRYSFKVDDIIYGGDRIDLEGKDKAPYFDLYPYAKNQHEALERIIKGSNRVLSEGGKTLQKPQPSKENKSNKPFRIPLIGGIVALASAWIFNNR